MLLKDFYRYFINELAQVYDIDEATAITNLMFEERAAVTKQSIITQPNKKIAIPAYQELDRDLARLKLGEPVQYVLGYAWFCSHRFKVSPAVLIPRPETEQLVQQAIDLFALNDSPAILDVGTGSSCIATSIKLKLINAAVTAIEVSSDALKIANNNADALSAAINFKQLNFLDESGWATLGSFDLIVSNPPYIPASEATGLHNNVTAHEPHLALFVADDTPFIFYEKIALFSLNHLNKGGSVLMETHADFARDVQKIFVEHGYEVTIQQDFFGKDRIVMATRYR